MEKRIENLEIAVAKLKEDKEGGDDEVEASEEMAEETEPSTNPKSIKTTEVKEFSAEEEIEKLKAENEKLKTELAESPADAPINTNKFSADKPVLTKKQYNKLSRQERFLHNLNK
jgi:predicted RNase H-like nuclease (RuvC/YqgF family)